MDDDVRGHGHRESHLEEQLEDGLRLQPLEERAALEQLLVHMDVELHRQLKWQLLKE